ncbi:hypothetical protein P8C59_005886 [Phyllachora maydis]|uniref:GH18 domain-containing protein n=1 Tax=Phyllachora maydis TaxID=1825666 RepID=A0AAD9I580_9PEZI|nr:hypothetical protein P8C59_005886 [Phyllachora maydis]
MPPITPGLPPLPRLITYYQTHHDPTGAHISVLPLLTQPGIRLSHLILAAIHLNSCPGDITLNDHPPSHPCYTTLWAELRVLQASGVRVLGMLGGAAKGTFTRLDYPGPDPDPDPDQFEAYYQPLAALVRARALDGLDLDVEEPMSLPGMLRLVDRLRGDFGPGFLITLAPVAAALLDARHNLSGFDYRALEAARGPDIAWYHAQFYCGWGDGSSPLMYHAILARGWLRPEKLVVGLVTNPENGAGFVPWHLVANVLPLLVRRHPGFGGVMGWEYFNALPGGRERPWEWARYMTGFLRGEEVMLEDVLKLSREEGGMGEAPAGNAAQVVVEEAASHGKAAEVDEDPDEPAVGDTPVPEAFEYYSDASEEVPGTQK